MEQNENNWKIGEEVSFPWTSTTLKTSGKTFYKHFYGSRFICIRPADEGKRGILIKVLGKTSPQDIMMVGGEPFCKDDRDELVTGKSYFSYRFPALSDLKEALAIIRENPKLLPIFDKAGMHLNPDSTFWIRESVRKILFRKPQIYDSRTGSLFTTTDGTSPYRIALLFFLKDEFTY
ncbi:MAG: hypothetical protein J6W52_02870 [Bacteroidaceae bacterium]|nr:hypothetical protein [Bacteroidaceae bacterium]